MNTIETLQIESTQITEFIKLNHCFFTGLNSATANIIQPVRITLHSLTALSNDLLDKEGTLTIQCKNNNYEIRVKCYNYTVEGECYIKLDFINTIPEELQNSILEYTTVKNDLEKRREERFDVGLKLTENFGLARKSQIMYTDNKEQIRCIINNVSMGGVLLTAEYANIVVGKNIVTLLVDFKTPIETLALKASVVRIEKKTGGFYRYSLKFIEPINFKWISRVSHYSN